MDERERMTERIIDFLYGETDEAERMTVERLIATESAWRQEHDRLKAVMNELDRLEEVEMPVELGEEIAGQLAREELLRRTEGGRARGGWRRFARAASVAALVLVAAGVVWFLVTGLPTVSAGPVEVVPVKVALTVFNDNLALVKDSRFLLNLPTGDSEVRFTNVAGRILSDSVRFESQTDPKGTRVMEQNYEYDLASPEALLRRYVDRDVTCVSKDGTMVTGKLLSFGGAEPPAWDDAQYQYEAPARYQGNDRGVNLPQMVQTTRPIRGRRRVEESKDLVVRGADGTVREVAREQLLKIDMEAMPEGLLTRPTLVWKLRTKRAGRNDMQLTYLTEGMSWRADYTAVITGEDRLALSGWVTITNESGSTYPNAELKLIAGDVHRVRFEPTHGRGLVGDLDWKGETNGYAFQEKAFFEYHLYTLGRTTTLKDKQTKQIKLMSAPVVKCTKRYLFEGSEYWSKAAVELEFKNEKDNGLGMPLPKGMVRVQGADADGEIQEIARESIDHTAKDELVKLRAGYAADVVGARKQIGFQETGRERLSTYEVTLRNHKDGAVKVTVRDHFALDWAVTKESEKSKSTDAFTYEWDLEVKPNEEKKLTYAVREKL